MSMVVGTSGESVPAGLLAAGSFPHEEKAMTAKAIKDSKKNFFILFIILVFTF
jgi:hypothetical protein